MSVSHMTIYLSVESGMYVRPLIKLGGQPKANRARLARCASFASMVKDSVTRMEVKLIMETTCAVILITEI